MLSLFLDAGALMLIVMIVNEDQELGWLKAVFVALAISLACVLTALSLATLGPVALYLGFGLLAVVAGLIV